MPIMRTIQITVPESDLAEIDRRIADLHVSGWPECTRARYLLMGARLLRNSVIETTPVPMLPAFDRIVTAEEMQRVAADTASRSPLRHGECKCPCGCTKPYRTTLAPGAPGAAWCARCRNPKHRRSPVRAVVRCACGAEIVSTSRTVRRWRCDTCKQKTRAEYRAKIKKEASRG